jgi:hypothetical protein
MKIPSVHTKHPKKKEEDAIGSSGAAGGSPHRNPARPAVLLDGEGAEGDLGFTRARFVCLVGEERLPEGVDGSTKRRPSRERLLQREDRRVWDTRSTGSSGSARERS